MDVSRCLRPLSALLLATLAYGCAPRQAAEPAPLVIRGYDPVAYFDVGPGKTEFEYEWDEQRYRFANARNLARFKQDPGRYAPRFGNNCAGALAFGLPFKADPDIFRVHEGRLYIFGSTDARAIFDKDPQRIITAAQRNYDRQRRGEMLEPELPLPPEAASTMRAAGRQCENDPHPPAFCGEASESDIRTIKHVLDNQPAVSEAAITEPPAARP